MLIARSLVTVTELLTSLSLRFIAPLDVPPKSRTVILHAHVVESFAFNKERMINLLKKHGFGKTLIRYEVNPEYYWQERNSIEREIFGKKIAVLFDFEGQGLICEEIE